jgi:hypothetical protein
MPRDNITNTSLRGVVGGYARLGIWNLDTETPALSSLIATYRLSQNKTGELSLYQHLVAFWCTSAVGRTVIFDWRLSRQDNYLAVVFKLPNVYDTLRVEGRLS